MERNEQALCRQQDDAIRDAVLAQGRRAQVAADENVVGVPLHIVENASAQDSQAEPSQRSQTPKRIGEPGDPGGEDQMRIVDRRDTVTA